jgi:hypothetical protein
VTRQFVLPKVVETPAQPAPEKPTAEPTTKKAASH